MMRAGAASAQQARELLLSESRLGARGQARSGAAAFAMTLAAMADDEDARKEDRDDGASNADHIVGVTAEGAKKCPASKRKDKRTALILLCIAGGPPAERLYLGYTT